jgi:hypothetical protein
MKKTTILLMLFCLGFIYQIVAQERQIIQGYCKDENGKAIENVSVYVHDSLLVSVTDEQGRFTYNLAKAGMKLRFAHMVFEPTHYTLTKKDLNGKPLTINMKTKKHELLEVEVTANAPHIAYDNPVMSVLDYVIRDDGLYLLVYRRHNSALLHLSFDLDTLHETPVSSQYKAINRDAFGDIYALDDYQASQVGFMGDGEKDTMVLFPPIPKLEFYERFSTIVAATDNTFVTGWYHFFNTGLSYDLNRLGSNEEPKLLHYIEDEEAAGSIRLRQGQYEVAFIEPVFAPVFADNDKFYLFAFVDHETLVYDSNGNRLKRYPLTFHEYHNWNGKMVPDRRWKQNVLMDAARKEFYTIFATDGIGTLKRIDLETGTATAVMDLSGYPFAQSVRVHDGMLYFIYTTGGNHRKSLYRVRID